jgi:opacity protein-like surface antigen
MNSFKRFAIAGAATLSLTSAGFAGDLPPPPVSVAAMPVQVFGNDSGFYLRGDVGVGVNNVGKHSIATTPISATATGVLGYNDDLSASSFVGIGAGYAVNNWLRFDGTLEYRGGAKLSSVDYYTPNAANDFKTGKDFYSANISSFVGLVNAYVDLGTWYCITPYVGLGLGFANNTISGFTDQGYSVASALSVNAGGPSGVYYGKGSTTNFAYAAMVGLGYDVSSNLKLDIGYRYLNMGKVTTGSSVPQFGPPTYKYTQKDLSSHDFRIGMRWVFADKSAPPPPSYSAPLVRKY